MKRRIGLSTPTHEVLQLRSKVQKKPGQRSRSLLETISDDEHSRYDFSCSPAMKSPEQPEILDNGGTLISPSCA